MGRDTIQLENAVSAISQEYMLEFTSEYGIPEDLHPELPRPEDTIVDFPEGKVGVYTRFFEFANFRIPISQFLFDILGYYQIHLSQLSVIGAAKRIFPTIVDWRINAPKDGMPAASSYSAADVTVLDTHHMDLFNLISAPNPTKVKTGTRPRAAHEVPLLTVTASRVIDMEDAAVVSESSGTPSTIEKSPHFDNENPPPLITERDGMEDQVYGAMGPLVNKRRRKRGNDEADANVPPKVLRKDHDAFRPAEKTSADTKSVNDPDPLSYAKPQPHPERDVAQSSRKTATEIPTGNVATTEVQGQIFAESPKSGKSASFPSVDGSLGGQITEKATTKIARQDQRIQAREEEIKKLDQEIKSLKAVEAELHNLHNQTKNLEALLEAEFLDFQVSNNQLSQQVSNLQAQVTGEEKIKAAFEEFKKYEDDKVKQRCAEMDARLDKLSMDFDEELYPHMLTAIAGHRWVIGHGLRLAVMKYRSWEAGRDLAAIEACDPEADSKYVKALQDLKDLKYPLVDQLEGLKDAPMDLIMASLHLESDSGEDAPSGSVTFALAPPN
ncbi:hypothetical protein Tco_1300516 [Tanacetum coccineum]